MKKIDVLLSMYNGEKYLREQLDSIVGQTMLPDTILIIDDCSTDLSVEIVEEYIKKYQKEIKWHLIKNKKNKGWKKNFFHGLQLCQGDYIFLCDQDDVWDRNKIQMMADVLDKNENINLLVCNYEAFAEEKEDSFVRRSKKFFNNENVEIIMPNEKVAYVGRPGCCFCVRKKFFESLENYWDVEVAHDAQLWRYSCVSDSLALLNKKLVRYRRHSNNVTKVAKTTYQMRMKDLKYLQEVFLNLLNYQNLSIKGKEIVKEEINFLEKRMDLFRGFSLNKAITLLKYHKYYANFGGYLKDIYLAIVK